MPAPLAPFSLPDRYRLEGGIAAGGMAAVYAAHDTVLDRPVAVKVLAEHLNEDHAARRRFEREGRAAAALSSHPAVVTIFDVGEHAGRAFIVMERRTGGTVGEQLAGSAVAPDRALGWLRQTADALDVAHERGVIHRDIKPANLLLDEHDRVAVADFGIARLAWESEQVTQTGQVLGTAAYISPEQAMGDPATAASDRYALAAVAFELLTGAKPFTAAHFAAQARAHIEDPLPDASGINPRLPRGVDAVLARGMAKEPEDRWPSAGAFVDALGDALVPEPTEATRAMAPQPRRAPAREPVTPPAGVPPVPPRTRTPEPGPPHEDRPGPRLGPVLLAALALVLVAVAAVAIALGGNDGGGSSSGSGGSGGGSGTAKATPTPKADKTPEATKTAAPTATATATETPSATATASPTASAPTGSDPAKLNDQGFALFQQQRYGDSVPFFRKAVESCGDSTQLACAYATFNLGAALNRSGDPASAIPYLQLRLKRWPGNQDGTVTKELRAACSSAGQDCGSAKTSAKPSAASGRGDGRGRGNGRGHRG